MPYLNCPNCRLSVYSAAAEARAVAVVQAVDGEAETGPSFADRALRPHRQREAVALLLPRRRRGRGRRRDELAHRSVERRRVEVTRAPPRPAAELERARVL